jgi:hypothetical protein
MKEELFSTLSWERQEIKRGPSIKYARVLLSWKLIWAIWLKTTNERKASVSGNRGFPCLGPVITLCTTGVRRDSYLRGICWNHYCDAGDIGREYIFGQAIIAMSTANNKPRGCYIESINDLQKIKSIKSVELIVCRILYNSLFSAASTFDNRSRYFKLFRTIVHFNSSLAS